MGSSHTSVTVAALQDLGEPASVGGVGADVGPAAGTEVVQVYAGPLPFLEAPERKLVGFAKVELDAGERATVRIDVEREQLSYWDENRERWITPTGEVPIYVGSSATDVRLAGRLDVR